MLQQQWTTITATTTAPAELWDSGGFPAEVELMHTKQTVAAPIPGTPTMHCIVVASWTHLWVGVSVCVHFSCEQILRIKIGPRELWWRGERDELVYTGGMLLDFEIWHLYVRSNSSYFCSRDDYENICVCVFEYYLQIKFGERRSAFLRHTISKDAGAVVVVLMAA